MTTKRKADTGRAVGALWSHSFADGSQAVKVRVKDGRKVDMYTVSRERDSLDVEWSHGTQPDRSYTVTVTVGGAAVACTCPGQTFRGGGCRHMAATRVMLAAGQLDNGPEPDGYPDGWGWSDERDEQDADYWRAVCGDSLRGGCR